MTLKVGDRAPQFTLPDQDNSEHSPSDYIGRWLLMWFYPKDNTTGCTAEGCGLRDNWVEFQNYNVAILGISVDSVKSHQKFLNTYAFPFWLLADENKEVVKKYGVWQKKKLWGREYMGTVRTSFLIDPKGKIAKIYEKVNPLNHAQEILEDLKQLQGAQ